MGVRERRIRHEGWMGYTCYFCGGNIGRLPAIILQLYDVHSEGYESGIMETHPHAHPGCARKKGLYELGDTTPDPDWEARP